MSNLPTAGDIAGGAVVSTSNPALGFRRIEFGSAADNPNGKVVPGVAIALGLPVNTERPAFTLAALQMGSEEILPGDTDPVAREQNLWAIAEASLRLY